MVDLVEGSTGGNDRLRSVAVCAGNLLNVNLNTE